MKIFLGDFNAEVGREDIFKLTNGNENLQEISYGDRIIVWEPPSKQFYPKRQSPSVLPSSQSACSIAVPSCIGSRLASQQSIRDGHPEHRLHCKLQTRPLVREGAQGEEKSNFPTKERKK
jgi:hypothetical protein